MWPTSFAPLKPLWGENRERERKRELRSFTIVKIWSLPVAVALRGF